MKKQVLISNTNLSLLHFLFWLLCLSFITSKPWSEVPNSDTSSACDLLYTALCPWLDLLVTVPLWSHLYFILFIYACMTCIICKQYINKYTFIYSSVLETITLSTRSILFELLWLYNNSQCLIQRVLYPCSHFSKFNYPFPYFYSFRRVLDSYCQKIF